MLSHNFNFSYGQTPARTPVSADISKNIFTATENVIQGRAADTAVETAIKQVIFTAALYYLAGQFTALS